MGKTFLDTDILIDLLRGEEKAVNTVKELIQRREQLYTTPINVFELYWGAYKLGGGKKVEAIDRLLTHLTIADFTPREAKASGEEIAYLESIGLPIDIRDLFIGVTARENNGALLTGNTKHYTRIKSLKTIKYEK